VTDAASPGPPPTSPALARTPLYAFHRGHGAHLVPFAGWEMPLYYESILAEHEAVRTHAGQFDVSHMGILTVVGGHADDLLSRRTTTNVARLEPGQCRYSFLLDPNGAITDDLLITRLDDGHHDERSYLVVPNAAHAPYVYDLLRSHRRPDTVVTRLNGAVAILAVQGPASRGILEQTFGWRLDGLKFYTARWFPRDPSTGGATPGRLGGALPTDLDREILVSRTGYTGEAGFELFVAGADATTLAERLEAAGARPCGLGARDTLRLEKGYLLSGQDFHGDRTPIEAGQDRFVELDHPFVGRGTVEKQHAEGTEVRLVGLVVQDEGAIPRHGTPIRHDGATVAQVTSGGLSPSLHHGIALAYLPTALTAAGSAVTLEIRGREVPARVAPLPFYPATPVRR